MTEECPIKLEVCVPSCYFWRDDKCQHKEVMAKANKVFLQSKGIIKGVAGLPDRALEEYEQGQM